MDDTTQPRAGQYPKDKHQTDNTSSSHPSPSTSVIFDTSDEDIEQNAPTKEASKTSPADADEPPPDGGLQAWTQAFMAHLVVVNTWGTINSFGIFQTFYRDYLSRPASDISWIGSMQVFFLFVVGVFTGRLTDAGYFRTVFGIGSALVVLGSLTASFATEYWQLFLSQGLCIGLGMGGLFCPVMAVLSTYFKRRRNLAIGIAISGSATGGMIYPVMARQLLPKIGFGWTMRVMALVQLVTLLVANIFMRSRLRPRRAGSLVELSAFKEKPYLLFTIGMFFNFWGVYFAFYYIGPFSRDKLSFSYDTSIDILMIMNGVGAIGRVIPGFLADLFLGPLNVVTPAAAVCTILLFSWMAIKSAAGLYAWAVIYGIFGATVQGLFPAALSSLTTDLRKAGTRMGMVYSIVSFANLTGPPLAGALIKIGGGEYTHLKRIKKLIPAYWKQAMANFQPIDMAIANPKPRFVNDPETNRSTRQHLRQMADYDGSHDYPYCWGFTIFRTAYESDEKFTKAVERLNNYAKHWAYHDLARSRGREPKDPLPNQDLSSRYYSDVIEDPGLAGADVEEVGRRFDDWVKEHLNSTDKRDVPNARFEFCLMLDQQSIDAILAMPEDRETVTADMDPPRNQRWIKLVTGEQWADRGWPKRGRLWCRAGIYEFWGLWFEIEDPDFVYEESGWAEDPWSETDGALNFWGIPGVDW
ncbi:hypothetical protein K4K53_007902 [Colletotrichum sp. SAR 10_77]|nr:hypothetical protein K4K53_007902 [Colletotrichum sp. SAR 10_77]